MRYLYIALSLFFLLGSSSCKRDKITALGPNMCPSSTFAVVDPLKVDTDKIDFVADSVLHFSGTFNEPIYWTLVIKGKSSLASKTFKGYSSSVSIDWYGNSDKLDSFFGVEECEAILTPSCLDKSYSASFSILKPSDFSKYGVLIYDFDKNNLSGPYIKVGATKCTHTSTDTIAGNIRKSPQGGKFYNMTFETINPTAPEWYFGGKTLPTLNWGKFKNEKVEDLYLNFYLNTNGKSLTQTCVLITEAGLQRKFFVEGNFSGWKLVSVRLSDMNIEDLSKTTSLDFIAGANPTQGLQAEINVDFIIVTKGAPFAQ